MFDINNPVNLTTGQPNGIYVDFYRYGILIDIQQSGIVGEVNYVFVLLQLTSGLVLLGVASSIVGFVAKFLMGDISPVYKHEYRRIELVICIKRITYAHAR